ncbi:ABC transporter [Sphingobium jiangsuense]|uniref:DUF808 domain-containing protein n=1 Tax=Sphingobium jiangsuense TaxID=870476 RepID=A0A7W6FPV4_9SPHN|nr:DUF808 domain-containing protein [Sphingobium jiangsuense]MBB3926263.1 hypothetical protein [Sphingobium jiangsuense]GLS99977.1 ABC transporter [Sphingobium jiangsuense]
MSVGLLALLDDIAALAKLAAASIDDVSAAAAKASAKAAGVVIDDAAVTPRYVTGLKPERELPIIGRIALGSVRNKLIFLLPAALLLSAFAPWALTPLLMLGGAYLCFEGAEKILGKWLPHGDGHGEAEAAPAPADPAHIEQATISGAVRTDLILSAEIMAIALATVAATPLWEQAVILVAVSLLITAGVYGVVALIVKMDDIGLHLYEEGSPAVRPLGKLLVHAMPKILAALTVIGTVAMLWVGGGIIVHGLETLGVPFPGHQIEAAAHAVSAASAGLFGWLASAALSAVAGLVIGGAIALIVPLFSRLRGKR